MREIIVSNLEARFAAYADLIDQSDEEALAAKPDLPKHKSLTEHLWCVVGARESYAKALQQGGWDGFSCSMTNFTQADFRTALNQSAQTVLATINEISDWTSQREELLATLAEHEVMHEGQIIRHVLATDNTLPDSWKWA